MSAAASTAHDVSALGGAHFTPAEVDLRGVEGGGLGHESPAARPSWVRRSRTAFASSVWAPVALKVLALAIGMLALAGVGIASILSGVGGVQVPLSASLGNDIHAAWLASKPAPSAAAHAGGAPNTSAGKSDAKTSASDTSGAPSESRTSGSPAASTTGASAGMTDDGKVILNLATVADLRHLPGVGAKRADAILALRARLGHFRNVNELMRVKGIGVRGLKKILPHVVLDAPKPSA
ncbi:MAG: helix-hairpin-helix domain-containing protein [Polyangiaceae bacterium]